MGLQVIAFDAETYYDSEYSLSKITTEQYIRSEKFEEIGCSFWMPEADRPVWYPGTRGFKFLQTLDWSKYALVAHNVWFDAAILSWRYGIRPKLLMCTWAMSQPRFALTGRTSLAAMAKLFKLPPKGDEVVRAKGMHFRDFTNDQLWQYGQYCIHDTWLTRTLLQNHLMPGFPISELKVIDQTARLFTEPRLMLDREMLVDYHRDVVNAKEQVFIHAMNVLGLESTEAVRTAIMSNEKLALLLADLGVDPPRKVSLTTGKETWAFAKTDEAFTELQDHPDECVQALVEARLGGKSTIAETRAVRFIGVSERGPLPVMLRYYAAHTGRFGGADGINLQNLMRGSKLRKAMMAPEGHVCVVGDSSQIEARILAWLSGQDDVTAAFLAYDRGEGPDIYCVTAARIYDRVITQEDDPLERQIGKVVRLALGFGMGWEKFLRVAKSQKVIFTPQQSFDVVKKFRDVSPGIVALWKAATAALEALLVGEPYAFGRNGLLQVDAYGIKLPNGMHVHYPELRREPDPLNPQNRKGVLMYTNRNKRVRVYGAKVIENVVQALARIVVTDQWLELSKTCKVVLQVHDELVEIVLASLADTAKADMSRVMSQAPAWAPGLPVSCSVGMHQRYGLAK